MSQLPDRPETFNPWSVVHLVFDHLAAEGLHPVLGDGGDPSVPAAQLLRALGVEPGRDSEGPAATTVQDDLARVRRSLGFPD